MLKAVRWGDPVEHTCSEQGNTLTHTCETKPLIPLICKCVHRYRENKIKLTLL